MKRVQEFFEDLMVGITLGVLACGIMVMIWALTGCGGENTPPIKGATWIANLPSGVSVWTLDKDPPDEVPLEILEKQLQGTSSYFSAYCKDQDCSPILDELDYIVVRNTCPFWCAGCKPAKNVFGYYRSWVNLIHVCAKTGVTVPWASGVLVHETIHHFEDLAHILGGTCLNEECMADGNHKSEYWNYVLWIALMAETVPGVLSEHPYSIFR